MPWLCVGPVIMLSRPPPNPSTDDLTTSVGLIDTGGPEASARRFVGTMTRRLGVTPMAKLSPAGLTDRGENRLSVEVTGEEGV